MSHPRPAADLSDVELRARIIGWTSERHRVHGAAGAILDGRLMLDCCEWRARGYSFTDCERRPKMTDSHRHRS